MKNPGIVIALLPEAACLAADPVINTPLQLTDRISLYITGMGAERTRRGAEQLLAGGADSLVSMGTTGALHPGLTPGTVVVPEKIIRQDGQTYDITASWRIRVIEKLAGTPLPTHTGNLAHSDSILCSRQEKSTLHQKSGAVAVDMESAVIAALAREKNVPVLALRAVVDTAAMVIPAPVLEHSDVFGKVSLPDLLFSLIRQPGKIPDFIRLARGFRSASDNLRWLGRRIDAILLSD